jgi:hypothetical protein
MSNATLDEATGFAGADHSLVDLSNTSLKGVDFSKALLYGAKLNGANLEGAALSHAFSNNDPTAKIQNAPAVRAHLKNVNLSGAQLSGADFGNASSEPCGPRQSDGRRSPTLCHELSCRRCLGRFPKENGSDLNHRSVIISPRSRHGAAISRQPAIC